jgi:hypothetical protein
MATYKGILITQQLESNDGLNTETDNPLLVVTSISTKLTDVNNIYTVTYNYLIYKNVSMLGVPINYTFSDLITTITVSGDSHLTNACYNQIGSYLTTNSVGYSYVSV